jgi:hypothetical protein
VLAGLIWPFSLSFGLYWSLTFAQAHSGRAAVLVDECRPFPMARQTARSLAAVKNVSLSANAAGAHPIILALFRKIKTRLTEASSPTARPHSFGFVLPK